MSKRCAMAILLLFALLAGVGVTTAATYNEATPVALSWAQYATQEGETRPHACMQYQLVKVGSSITIECAEQ